jgi:hypothetical protein
MTNAISVISFRFNGEMKNYRLYDIRVQAVAKSANPSGENLLGELLSVQEYAIREPNKAPYVRLVHPGARPVLGIANPNATQLGVHNDNLKLFDYRLELFIKQEEALAIFKANYIDSLDETPRSMIEDPIHGTMALSIREIREILKTHFGTLSPGDMTKLYEEAIAPYTPGMDMLNFITSKNMIFAELAVWGEVFSTLTRIRILMAQVKSSGMFEETITFWENNNLTIASQVQNASMLSTALITAYVKNKGLTAGYRHQINAALTEENIEKRIHAGIIAGIAASAAKDADATCATCKVKVTVKNKFGKPLKYCNKCYVKFKADRAVT